jgi:PAS domain-containing protein
MGFRSIFEHAPRPAARCNPQGVIIEMNSAFAQALQAGLADQRALRLSDLVAPDDRKATESLLHNLLDCTWAVSAATLQDSTGKETHGAENLQKAVARLREQAYSAVVIDQFLPENEPAAAIRCSSIWAQRFPVYLNFAMSGRERLVREVVPRSTGASGKRLRLGARSSNSFAAKCVKASHPFCSPADWPCPFPECPDLRRKKIGAVDYPAREMRLRPGATDRSR